MARQEFLALDVSGVGAVAAKALSGHGIGTARALAEAPLDKLASVPGFGPARAERIRKAAAKLIAGAAAVPRPAVRGAPATTRKRKPAATVDATADTAKKGVRTGSKMSGAADKAKRKALEKAARAEKKASKKAARAEKKAARAEKKASKKAARAEKRASKKAAKAKKGAGKAGKKARKTGG